MPTIKMTYGFNSKGFSSTWSSERRRLGEIGCRPYYECCKEMRDIKADHPPAEVEIIILVGSQKSKDSGRLA